MANEAQLALLIKARDEASKTLDSINSKIGDLEGGAKKGSPALGALKGAMAGVVGSGLVGFLSDSANAAADEEANIARLEGALANVGVSYAEVQDSLEGYVASLGKKGIADDKARDSIATLTQITGDYNRAMELMPLAMDLARAKNIDFEQAAQLVGRVSEGNTSILKRYGIVIDDGASATDALAAMTEKFGGAADRYGATTKGTLDSWKVSLGNLQENLGGALGSAMPFIAMLPGLSTGFSTVSGAVGGVAGAIGKAGGAAGLIGSFGGLMGAMGPLLPVIAAIAAAVAAGIVIWKYHDQILAGLKVAYNALKDVAWTVVGALQTAWNTIKGVFWTVVNAILGFLRDNWGLIVSIIGGPLGAVLVQVIKHWDDIKGAFVAAWNAIEGFFRAAWEVFKAIFVNTFEVIAGLALIVWEHIKAPIYAAWNAIHGWFVAAFETFKGIFQACWDAIRTAAEAAWNAIKGAVTAIWQQLHDWFAGPIETFKSIFATAWGAIKTAAERGWDAIKGAVTKVWNQLHDWFAGPIETFKGLFSDAWSAIETGAGAAWERIKNIITTAFEGVKDGVKSVLNGLIRLVNGMIGGLNRLVDVLNKIKIGSDIPHIPTIPELAQGGIVTRPTLALIGEAGPEAVVPLSRVGTATSAAPVVVNVTVNTGDLVSEDPSGLAEQVAAMAASAVQRALGQQASRRLAFGV